MRNPLISNVVLLIDGPGICKVWLLPIPVFLQIPPKNPMGPKPSQPQSGELFRPRLDEQLNMKHTLVRLAALIDWAEIERTFEASHVW